MCTLTENLIRRHYKRLRSIYGPLGLPIAGDIKALRRLSLIEKKLHQHAELRCNEPLDNRQLASQERYKENAIEEIKAFFPRVAKYIRANGDPRGYAIKIDPCIDDPNGMKADEEIINLMMECGIHRDWGGFGILDPAAQLRD